MPRLYMVGNDRKRGPSSRASRMATRQQQSSSSSLPTAAASYVAAASSSEASKQPAQKPDNADIDSDRFEYDAFDYGDNEYSSHDNAANVGSSNAQSLQSKSSSSAVGNETHTSSSLLRSSNTHRSDNAMRAGASTTSSSSSSSLSLLVDEIKTTTDSNNTRKTKRISNSSSHGSSMQSTTSNMKPTVTSPRITHSDLLTKNNSSNTTTKSSARCDNAGSNKKMLLGNPITKSSSSSSLNNGKKKTNENAPDTTHNQQRRASTSTADGGVDTSNSETEEEEQQQQPKPKKQQRQQQQQKQRGKRQVSFDNHTKSSSGWDHDDIDACLQDTDDECGGEADSDTKIVQKKKSAATKATRGGVKRKSKANSSCTTTQRHESNANDPHEQTSPKIQVLPQRILAIDNRALPTAIGDSMARSSFLKYIPQLVMGGLEKGILHALPDATAAGISSNSTILASFVCESKSSEHDEETVGNKRAGALAYISIVPRVSYLFDRNDHLPGGGTASTKNERSIWLSDFVSPVSNAFGSHDLTNVDESKRICDGFSAEDGWSYFGDLVEAIEAKFFHSVGKSSSSSCARSITLFTTDANLLSDTSSSAHLRGLENFVKRIRSSFKKKRMPTITLMIVESTTMMHLMKTKSYDSVVMDDDSNIESLLPNRLLVIQCVNNIRRRIEEINQAHGVTKIPINLQLEFMDGNAISFQYLLQTWVKESLDQTYAYPERGVGGVVGGQGRLSFDLPETLDGVMCSISLDLQYTILPHRIDSPATKDLVDDMHRISMISPSSVEVVQTMPLSSVDASLIHGVPMIARAGFEKDESRYDEMKMLVRQLWTYLSRNSVALVLRVHHPESDEKDLNERGLSKTRSFEYHSSGEQLFLLICEEAVQSQPQALDHDSNVDISAALEIVPDNRRHVESPCHGVLYRYATMSQLLHFEIEEKGLETIEENVPGLSDHYLDYIERSLDSIVRTGVNPFLMGGNISG